MKRPYEKPTLIERTKSETPIRFPAKWTKPEISRTPTPNTVATILIPKPEEPK